MNRIGITWRPSDSHGWGVFGLNLALNLIRNGPTTPMLFAEPVLYHGAAETAALLAPYIEEARRLATGLPDSGDPALFGDATLIHALGNDFGHGPLSDRAQGRHNVGFVFFEDAAIGPDALARARRWERILVGSTWNREVCLAAGLEDVRFVSQGIDPNLFRPLPGGGGHKGRFVIFSGGKLELRKGQDLVLEAFRRFHPRHPDSLLVTAWQNHWPETAETVLASPYIHSLPPAGPDGTLDIAAWAGAHGLPPGSVIDAGWVANARLPDLLRQADVGLFPNRCEGGTNLAAMEVMACGVPCILSANTGHLDLIGDDNAYVLHRQTPGNFPGDPAGHWRESSVEEIVHALEAAYVDAAGRRRRGERAAAFMANLSWENQVAGIVEAIRDLL